MTRIEKAAKRLELIERAYQAIIEQDKWDNYGSWTDDATLSDERTEEHELYMSVAKEIEMLV